MASSNGNGHPDLLPYYGLIHDYLRRFECREASADDLAQNVYFRAYRALDNGSIPRNAKAWLSSIARHVGYEQIRRNGQRPSVTLDDAMESFLYDEKVGEPLDGIVNSEAKARLRQALDGLTREQQLLVHAYYAPDRDIFDP